MKWLSTVPSDGILTMNLRVPPPQRPEKEEVSMRAKSVRSRYPWYWLMEKPLGGCRNELSAQKLSLVPVRVLAPGAMVEPSPLTGILWSLISKF